jgi:hypothetical protein
MAHGRPVRPRQWFFAAETTMPEPKVRYLKT